MPDSLREKHPWATDGSVVSIKSTGPEQIVIEPYSPAKKTDWDQFWKDLKRVRSYKGKAKTTLSSTELLVKDRETHF